MVKTTDKILLGVLVVLLVASSGALITAFSPNADRADSLTAVQMTTRTGDISVAEAKLIALGEVPGIVTEFEIEKKFGMTLYAVEITNGDVETEVLINPRTGVIVSVEIDEDQEITEEELEKINGLITKEQAIAIAQKEVGGGFFVSFESEIEHGQIIFEVELRLNGERVEVEIDAQTGDVIEVEYGEDDD